MSTRSDTNRSGGSLHDGREIDVSTSFQVKPHRSFKPEAIFPRTSPGFISDGDAPIPVLARPPAWASREDLPCARSSAVWQLMDARERDFHWETSDEAKAAELCSGCPVRKRCLASALEEEWGLGERARYLVRGGLTPKGRWSLATSPDGLVT